MIRDLDADELPIQPTREELRRFLQQGWGEVGARVYRAWDEYNGRYFDHTLRPCVIAMTPVSPYGRWSGLSCKYVGAEGAHLMYLATSGKLNGGRGVLLHEMIHVHLWQVGLPAGHDGQPWCDEVTRLSALLGRPDIVAGRRKSVRRGGKIRKEVPEGCIPHAAVASWPHSCGIDLGPY